MFSYTKRDYGFFMSHFLTLTLILLTLTGCDYYKPVVDTIPELNQVVIKENPALERAAQAIQQSIVDLKALEKSARPNQNIKTLPQLDNAQMTEIITLDWVGELEPLLTSIAKRLNYRLRILGKQPIMPLIVSISAQKVPLGDIISNAHVQAGTQADIFIYPKEHIIELRYAS